MNRPHLLLFYWLAALWLTACSSAASDPAPAPTPSAPATGTPTDGAGVPDAGGPIVASWEIGAPGVVLPDGSVVVHCEGDAPLLCIGRNGEPVGLLALSNFDLSPDLRAAVEADALEDGLRRWADDHLRSMAADRAAGCGDGYTFAAEDVASASIGTQPGVHVGFTGTEDGAITEHVRSYVTVADAKLWIVTAEAASPDGCMASDELLVFEPSVMAELLPLLDRVVAGTPLPADA